MSSTNDGREDMKRVAEGSRNRATKDDRSKWRYITFDAFLRNGLGGSGASRQDTCVT
jgi:hypothetical protein